jgi:hypothetical protein
MNRFSPGNQMFRARLVRGGKKSSFFQKKSFFAVDGYFPMDTLLTPPEAGLRSRKTTELVLAYFGTAN